ncbi:Phosphoprotein phosphatase [Mycena sanguinolenta]|uniref:Mitochondrial import inner membrane translocase subunit TIM50 n=1 Tax=Mycena sanguinolenta TaxID=230812 RepID=A0A8H6ZEI2_9AGAR|nr:Phosphoprotein phosphatase [Mycena sanguinolenta]
MAAAQAPRKLLVLDLNGTLLLRAQRRSASSTPNFGPRLRTVHPRPYMDAFKEYIFHPSTTKWLDAMVWSSAQPHSVADMLNHCFGQQQREFLAIWARDTLGLPSELYNKKTPTTKDLAKIWAAFPEHSQQTTLLLDDSARKAHLHPYNHICVLEYVLDVRKHDLDVWRSSLPADTVPAKPKKQKAPKSKQVPQAPDLASAVDTPGECASALACVFHNHNVAEWIKDGGLLAKEVKEAVAEQPRPLSPDSLAHQMVGLNLAQELWFNSEATVNHWVRRGMHALEALQIPVVAGIRGGELPPART